MQDTSKRQR